MSQGKFYFCYLENGIPVYAESESDAKEMALEMLKETIHSNPEDLIWVIEQEDDSREEE